MIVAGSAAYGAYSQSQAAKKAANAQGKAADAGIAEQQRQFDTSLALQAPQRQIGNSATNALARMLGLPEFSQEQENFRQGLDANGNSLTSLVGDTELPLEGRTFVQKGKGIYDVLYNGQDVGDLVPGGPNGRFVASGAPIPQPQMQSVPGKMADSKISMNPTGTPGVAAPNADFFASPDYAFRRSEGNRDIQSQFAARGGAQSGNALRALAEFNSNLASSEFGNRFNRLASLAGFAQQANSQGAQNAINTGRGVAAGLQDAGNARASGVAGRNEALQQGINGVAGTIPLFQDAFDQYRQRNALARQGSRGRGGQYNTEGFSDG